MNALPEMLVNIDVPELDRAVQFYEAALGLRLSRKLFDATVAEMLGAPTPIYLLQKPEGSRSGMNLRAYARHWTPVHLDFVVIDLAAAVVRAVDAGARLECGPQTYPWGDLANLSDPFGHGFCLLQWRGDGYAASS